MAKKSKFVYAYNQNEAKAEFREKNKCLTPTKAKFAGTKHNMRVYQVWYKKKKTKKCR